MLIRLLALDAQAVAAGLALAESADARGIRPSGLDHLRKLTERRAGKALDGYRHVIDANNNYERAALVFRTLHEAAGMCTTNEAADVGAELEKDALNFARRNIAGLTLERVSDESLMGLLRTLTSKGLPHVKRVEECLPVLRKLGLAPNSLLNTSQRLAETLRKKLPATLDERRSIFGLPRP